MLAKLGGGRRRRAVTTSLRSLRKSQGSVTAELATALPAIVLVAAGLVDLFATLSLYLQAGQIAQRAAEAITRHEELSGVQAMVASALPQSRLSITSSGDYSNVRISIPALWPKGLRISASAIAHN